MGRIKFRYIKCHYIFIIIIIITQLLCGLFSNGFIASLIVIFALFSWAPGCRRTSHPYPWSPFGSDDNKRWFRTAPQQTPADWLAASATPATQ